MIVMSVFVLPKFTGLYESLGANLAGKPLAEGEVTLISLNQAAPKVFTAAVKDGAYKFAEAVPAGKYACAVSGKGVAEKYALANTSGLTLEFATGANNRDIELK